MMASGSSTPALPPTASALPGTEASPELFELEKRVKSGGSWYYWVAALSLVNSVVAFSGGGGGFVIGLSVTQFVDAMLSADGGVMKGVGLALGVLAAGVFALFGVFACKRHVWAFIVGMLLYGLDTILTVLDQQWLGLAFHGWVLFSLFIGTRAAMQINALSKSR